MVWNWDLPTVGANKLHLGVSNLLSTGEALIIRILHTLFEIVSNPAIIAFPRFQCEPLRFGLNDHGTVAKEHKNVNFTDLPRLRFKKIHVRVDPGLAENQFEPIATEGFRKAPTVLHCRGRIGLVYRHPVERGFIERFDES